MKGISENHLQLFANLSSILSQTFKDIQSIFLSQIHSRDNNPNPTQKPQLASSKLAWLDQKEEEKAKDSSLDDQNSNEEARSQISLPKPIKQKKSKLKLRDENGESKQKKKKKIAKWQLAGKPKPPVNSFMLFLQDTKFEIMEAKPQLTPSEISTYASGLWNELTNEEKERYKSEYRSNKAEYEERLKEYHQKQKQKEKANGKPFSKQNSKGPQKAEQVHGKMEKDILDMKIDMIDDGDDESNSMGGF